jgi:hypothetical protein
MSDRAQIVKKKDRAQRRFAVTSLRVLASPKQHRCDCQAAAHRDNAPATHDARFMNVRARAASKARERAV